MKNNRHTHPMKHMNIITPITHTSDIDVAKNLLETEIKGLQALEDWLSQDFVDVLDVISGLKGRLIISGMGKSGHVGKKIAATLASTGTPAFFIHPGEASHGDLGMVTSDDALMLLSNSGETAELSDLIHYAGRFDIPLIAIVRRKTSQLVDSADIALILPEVPEACRVDAPTTSTTMMMALGDAISVALLERKGFQKDDFNVFHPGGKLGAAFKKVSDLMHKTSELPLVTMDTPMADVLLEMTAKHFGCSGVIDSQGCLIGVITDGDLRRYMDVLMKSSAHDVMTRNPVTIQSNLLASNALALMQDKAITSLFIIDEEKKPVGILHIHDLLRSGVR